MVSRAWPKVWPKFRISRRPDSRSSRLTTWALISRRARDDVRESGGIAAKDRVEVFFEIGEEFRVGDDAVFDDFGETAAILAFGERLQHGGIDQDQAGGIESADEVLPFRKIHAGFSADGAVHLGDQRGGDLHERDAAQAGGGGKTGYVADYAAANGDDQ